MNSDFVIRNGELVRYHGHSSEIVIPDGVAVIGGSAFEFCAYAERVVIPDGVIVIGAHAFSGCYHLREVVIPDSVEKIGSLAFYGCRSLSKVTLPESVTGIGESAFAGCFALTGMTIPSGMAAIAENTFSGCAGLTQMVIPDTVKRIGNRAFADCVNLQTIRLEGNDTTLPGDAISGCKALKHVGLPENYFVRQDRCPAALIPFVRPASNKEMAYLWMFQDNKWQAWVQQQKPDVNLLAAEMPEILQEMEKLTAKPVNRLVELIDWGYPAIHSEQVKAICDAVTAKDAKTAKKFLQNEAVQKGMRDERIVEAEEPIEAFARSVLEKRPMHPGATVFTKGIPYAGQEKLCSSQLLNILVSEYLYVYDCCQKQEDGEIGTSVVLSLPQNFEIPSDAEVIAASLDRVSLSNALEGLVYSCAKQYRPWMYVYARFATEESAKKLLHHPPSGPKSKVSRWRENLEEAMLLSETKAAAEAMEKKGQLERYARMRGLSVQEFRDRHSLPAWNMNENGIIASAFGRLGYVVTPTLSLRAMEVSTGKELRSVSAKTHPDAAQEFKVLKKEAEAFYKKRSEYIRAIYITAERIAVKHWMETYYSNPILRPITDKVIWSDATGATFMSMGATICTVDGAVYEPKESVQIAHVLEMSTEQIDAWQKHLQACGKTLLIEQVWEPVAVIENAALCERMVLTKEERNEFKRVLGRKAIAVRSENDYSEFDYYKNQYVFSGSGTMYVGNTLQIRYEVDPDTGETTLCHFHSCNVEARRELNTVLYELGRICIKSAIRQDVMELLARLLTTDFTAAQIAEFIRVAQEVQSANATVMLLEYQQRHFPDFDPMAEFTLD